MSGLYKILSCSQNIDKYSVGAKGWGRLYIVNIHYPGSSCVTVHISPWLF